MAFRSFYSFTCATLVNSSLREKCASKEILVIITQNPLSGLLLLESRWAYESAVASYFDFTIKRQFLDG
jgi:hypothetical protein